MPPRARRPCHDGPRIHHQRSRPMVAPAPQRTFVPLDFDAGNFDDIEPLYRSLLDRPVDTPARLDRWLLDASEVAAAIDEYAARRYIDKSCQTDNPEFERAFLHYIENVEPGVKPLQFELQRKYLASPARDQLAGTRYAVLGRRWAADVELFRNENVPIETEVTRLVTDYDKTMAAMTIEFRGGTYTPQQMAR